MAREKQNHSDLAGVPSHERHFYSNERAFGRFGMRIFKPQTMDHAHWHGHVEVNLVTDARLIYDMDGERIVVPEGGMALFWAGIPHQLLEVVQTGPNPPRLANLYLPLDAFLFMPHIGQIQVNILGGGCALLPADLCRPDQMRRWYGDYRSRDFERVNIIKDELNVLLRRAQTTDITWLRASRADPTDARVIPTSHIRQVVDMVRYILENLSEPLTNADVARVTGLHQNYALSLFSKTMRLPMKRFVIRMRMLRARALLLQSSMAISTVATEAGFTSISQFYEHFKSAYGMSPHAMRARYATMALK